jgi:hypothetical protein
MRGELWLTALGRARPGKAAHKHSIKAVDRLLGNGLLYAQRKTVYSAVATQLLRKRSSPVILVDTMEVQTGAYALTASIACDGRSFPVYSVVTSQQKVVASTSRRFLRDLSLILPDNCRPILVTDAGFESPWFREVDAIGWDYVGRVRNTTRFFVDGNWVGNQQLYRRATQRARNLGVVPFPRSAAHPRRLVLSSMPSSSHRQRLTSRGTPGRRGDDRNKSKGASEPWLLATSLACRPEQVVAIFALRMQIEETFRDTKCHRWGWSLRHCRSRSFLRLELLLLIAAVAYFVQQSVGFAAEQLSLHHRYQANTIRDRRVLSHFLLGGFVLRSSDHALIEAPFFQRTFRVLQNLIRDLAPVPR